VKLDEAFRRTLEDHVRVRVIAGGEGEGQVRAGSRQIPLRTDPTRWSETEFAMPVSEWPREPGVAEVEVRTLRGHLDVHLIEVRRGPR
jgi:hypothetical protein